MLLTPLLFAQDAPNIISSEQFIHVEMGNQQLCTKEIKDHVPSSSERIIVIQCLLYVHFFFWLRGGCFLFLNVVNGNNHHTNKYQYAQWYNDVID